MLLVCLASQLVHYAAALELHHTMNFSDLLHEVGGRFVHEHDFICVSDVLHNYLTDDLHWLLYPL